MLVRELLVHELLGFGLEALDKCGHVLVCIRVLACLLCECVFRVWVRGAGGANTHRGVCRTNVLIYIHTDTIRVQGVCVCVCVRARVHACMNVCVSECVCVCICGCTYAYSVTYRVDCRSI